METSFQQRWQMAWQNKNFRQLFVTGFILLVAVLGFLPFFFKLIEQREGLVMNDLLLKHFTPYNVSTTIFIVIWGTALLSIVRCIQQPSILIVLLWGYVLLTILRMVTITLVPLNPPASLLELKDPLSNTFYGSKFITKDLFFSGHTSTMFLMYLCFKNKWDRTVGLLASIIVGVLVLVQHIHYTMDVLAVPPFTYLIFIAAKKITGKQ